MFPKAVLFDFDGVVVDSFKAHYTAWSDAFFQLFQTPISPFPSQTHAGKSPILIAEYFCEQIGEKDKAEALYDLKGELLHKGAIVPDLLPGVNEVQGLIAERAVPYGIASNATKQFLTNSIQQLSIQFETYFGVEDYDFPKPHPEAYIKLAKALGVDENNFENTWVFEDSLTGTTAAKKAGMFPVGILTQYTEGELRSAGSQLVFPTLFEVYLHLKEMS